MCLGVTFSAGGGLKGNNRGMARWRDVQLKKKRKGGRQKNIGSQTTVKPPQENELLCFRERGPKGQETGMRLHNCSCY